MSLLNTLNNPSAVRAEKSNRTSFSSNNFHQMFLVAANEICTTISWNCEAPPPPTTHQWLQDVLIEQSSLGHATVCHRGSEWAISKPEFASVSGILLILLLCCGLFALPTSPKPQIMNYCPDILLQSYPIQFWITVPFKIARHLHPQVAKLSLKITLYTNPALFLGIPVRLLTNA